MKPRFLLAAVALAGLLGACASDAPTGARPPERAAFDGTPAPTNPPTDSTQDDRGGSFGSGH